MFLQPNNPFIKRQKSFISRFLFNHIFLFFIGLILIILISIPLLKNINKQYRVSREIKELENEISALENKNFQLNGMMAYLNSEEFIQKQARLNLNFKQVGEGVAVITGIDQSASGTGAKALADTLFSIPGFSQARSENKKPNPVKWWGYFFSTDRQAINIY